MLRIIQNSSTAGAKSYYSTADYYTEGQELAGVWRGEGARLLGLSGDIQRDAWEALCDNLDPRSGQRLTARTRDDRRIGFDFNFHVSKSVSLLYSLTRDERILEAFRESVEATMGEMEAEMQTRVRKDGRNEDRVTGNMVWGQFTHFTSRPVDGVPDPHLHAHCFVFNTTWDNQERAWKAGQFRGLKRDAPYFEAVFHSRLAERLAGLGYAIERNAKGWEIGGIATDTLAKFSRRTAQIEQVAAELGVSDPKQKDGLGAKTREKKAKNLSADQLAAEWQARLSAEESRVLAATRSNAVPGKQVLDPAAPQEAMGYAMEHCFERKSVVPERTVLAAALRRSAGRAAVEDVLRQASISGLIIGTRNGRRMATTPTVLKEEQRLIQFAREGRGACRPLGDPDRRFQRAWLNEDQRAAVRHVLGSTDRVMLIRGQAGVGKTSLMQEAAEAIREAGREIFAVAPSADASRGVLRESGFANAETVARLLKDEKLQAEAAGQVVWVDEAGLLGTKTLAELFALADRIGCRVVLQGDPSQHHAVERGDPMRLLEQEAGLVSAQVREIQRQGGQYKEAVRQLSEGRTSEGFQALSQLGWVREVPDAERYQELAAAYVAAVEGGKTALVVSPTHSEGNRVTEHCRDMLRGIGRLHGPEREFVSLRNANLTAAERSDFVNYAAGDVLQFHQNAKGHARGSRVSVGFPSAVPVALAGRFQVFRPVTVRFAAGDRIRITHNGKTKDGKHDLRNGSIYHIQGFSKTGDIVLENGWTIAKDFGHLTHGYVVTSHSSQGKTVDVTLVAQSSQSFPASSREQFYVSASRSRQQVIVFTDDALALGEAIKHTDERLHAVELFHPDQERLEWLLQQRRERERQTAANERQPDRERELAYER